MTFDVEVAPEGVEKLEALRRASQAATEQMITGGGTAADRMVAFVMVGAGQAWERRAPRLTGTLALATREQVFDGDGKVFIDPVVINPVFGGRPGEYGPAVHRRKPWVGDVFAQDLPPILVQAGERFFGEIDEEYARELG